MSEHDKQLDQAVDAGLKRLAGALDAVPVAGLDDRLKTAVRAELSADLLANFSHPRPDPETLQRVRSAVHRELQRTRAEAVPRISRAAWLRGVFAAAAVLALGVGVARWSVRTVSVEPVLLVEASAEDPAILQFVEVSSGVLGADSLTDTMDSDLEAIEDGISQWNSYWQDVEKLLGELDETTAGQSRGKARPVHLVRAAARHLDSGVMG